MNTEKEKSTEVLNDFSSTEENILKYQADFYEASSEVSKISRNLVFAILGVLWIFKNPAPNSGSFIPEGLKLPLLFIFLFIIVDLSHYIFRTVSILIFYKNKRDKYNSQIEKDTDPDFVQYPDYPSYIDTWSWIHFIVKISFSLTAFVLVIIFLYNRLF